MSCIKQKEQRRLNHSGSFAMAVSQHALIPLHKCVQKNIPGGTFPISWHSKIAMMQKAVFILWSRTREIVDYNYDIEDCEAIIGELNDGGWEVGLHGGHTTYTDKVEMKEKKQRLEKVLNKEVVGYRNHYLRFRVPDTWEHLHQAGFRYDATFGYADCIGFRNGMCHPFRPYNLTTQSEIDILEIPLTIMDDTLSYYMKLDIGTSWEMTKRLIDTVERNRGVISLLWHNYILIGEQRKFYEKILKYCAGKDAWMTSGKEISRWFDHNRG